MTLIKTKGAKPGNRDVQNAGILSKTALNRLNMQTPELSQYVVAFKDLSTELPENTGIQVGMIILDMMGKYIYVPVMAKAGEVQLLESMFDADTKKFIPLTRKSVEWMIEKGHLLGTAERIPSSVARDPDLYDAIVPPKTGKFVYASEGRLGGFFSHMPNHIKQATLEVITNDMAFQQAMAPLMDLDIAKAFLESETPTADVLEMGPPAPQVITSAAGLSEEQVQEVLAKGYTVKNPPKSTRVAVESSSAQALTTLSALPYGRAVMAMKKNGDWVGVAAVRPAVRPVLTYTSEKMNSTGNRSSSSTGELDSGFLAVTEDGHLLTNPKVVVDNAEVKYDDVIDKLTCKKLTDVNIGEFGMAFTGFGWYGPLSVDSVDKANGWTTINGQGHSIAIHPNVKAMYDFQGTQAIMSSSAMFYPLKRDEDHLMERDINTASMKHEMAMAKVLNVQANLMHRNGVYAVDGKEIGGKPQIVEHLLRSWEIDVPTVETLVQSAEKKNSILVKMAAVRGGGRPSPGKGTKVQAHYQNGEQPGSDDSQLTGNARQRAMGMVNSGKVVKDVADREVMEATLISEMLQNPDLSGSIQEYLPDIKDSVDKLGRTLFLMRINTNKLSESVDAEALNNLFTATRNAYRIVGENCILLENLAANELD